ncbi:MAG: extracellular solute-binding protein [Tyzzerella sp.]|nr:extracellular solute-binding protein [Tyzzerella sp.]
MKKKLLSLVLVFAMMLTMVACGSKDGDSQAGKDTTPNGDTPAYVTAPITIDFWHTFGAGVYGEYIADAVQRFNDTNEYGITVNATYIGPYTTVRTSLTTSIGAADNPQVAILGMSDILASAGVLADMTPYAERDGYSTDRFYDGIQTSMYYEDQLTALPFIRSCLMYYYNVDMFAAAGYDAAPTTIEEMVEACKAVSAKYNNYGFEMLNEASFVQEYLVRSMGSEGILDENREGASCLEDGTMLKLLTDWSTWTEDGWCAVPKVTDSQNNMCKMLYSGEVASCIASSALLTTIIDNAKESGQNFEAVAVPGYDGSGSVGGGGDISVIAANNDEQQIAAAWEFVKFMMSDEEIAIRSEETGYLPTTEGAADLMGDLFAGDANMQRAYEARQTCADVEGSIERSEWQTQVEAAFSYVIQDGSMSPKEAIEYLEGLLPTVFY